MQPLPRPSVTSLPAYASIPSHRAVSFSAAVGQIVRWLTNRQPKPTKSELQLEQRIVDLLAEELRPGRD
jgi:hypothetical protein